MLCESSTVFIDGASYLTFIVGDPVDTLKSPHTLTAAFRARGFNAVMLPAHVAADHIEAFLDGARHIQNLRGCLITMPHKLRVAGYCARLSARATFLGAVNIIRRQPTGKWFGDNLDGEGFMRALAPGLGLGSVAGKAAFLMGAGGVGSAIALALLSAGLSRLRVRDQDVARQHDLISRLDKLYPGRAAAADGTGDNDLVINATPRGMNINDPPSIVLTEHNRPALVADVVTSAAPTSLIAQAREMGIATVTGLEMLTTQIELAIAFFHLNGSPSQSR
jgi:shikimate dehydrogenase